MMKNYFSFSFLEKAVRRLFPGQCVFTVCIPKPFVEIRRLDTEGIKVPSLKPAQLMQVRVNNSASFKDKAIRAVCLNMCGENQQLPAQD